MVLYYNPCLDNEALHQHHSEHGQQAVGGDDQTDLVSFIPCTPMSSPSSVPRVVTTMLLLKAARIHLTPQLVVQKWSYRNTAGSGNITRQSGR